MTAPRRDAYADRAFFIVLEAAMDIKKLHEVAKKLPWDAIAGKLPTPALKAEFDAIKKDFQELLKMLEGRPLNRELQGKVEAIATRFHNIAKDMNTRFSPGAELYSRARLNEISIWNVCDYAERALYLAGRASVDKAVEEPYRTQIINQASHACLLRYRQTYKIKDYIFQKLEGALDPQVEFTVNQLSTSLLNQLVYFSDLAYMSNREHTLSAYHRALANLIVGHERDVTGHKDEGARHAQLALDLVHDIKTPARGIHYMQRQYHIGNYTEFQTFTRLSQKHGAILTRLKHLHDSARLLDESDVTTPKAHFNVDWIVGPGQRTASVAGIMLALYAASDIDIGSVKAAIGELWQGVVGHVLAESPSVGDVQRGAEIVAANTGGLASLASNTGGLASVGINTGGLAGKLSMLA
ncbi:MAG: hypothetical protein AB7O44_05460 [Hyphomicrobiaceae bacterium]